MYKFKVRQLKELFNLSSIDSGMHYIILRKYLDQTLLLKKFDEQFKDEYGALVRAFGEIKRVDSKKDTSKLTKLH